MGMSGGAPNHVLMKVIGMHSWRPSDGAGGAEDDVDGEEREDVRIAGVVLDERHADDGHRG